MIGREDLIEAMFVEANGSQLLYFLSQMSQPSLYLFVCASATWEFLSLFVLNSSQQELQE